MLPLSVCMTIPFVLSLCLCATALGTHCNATWKAVGLACSKSCGGGVRGEKYEVQTAASGVGAKACEATNGTTRTVACNTQLCGMLLPTMAKSFFSFFSFQFCGPHSCQSIYLCCKICKQHETSLQAKYTKLRETVSHLNFFYCDAPPSVESWRAFYE